MKRLISLLTGILALCVMSPVAVAEVAVAEIDTPWVFIGMPRVLHLEITVPEGTQVQWPQSVQSQGIIATDYQEPSKQYLLEFGPDTRLQIDTVMQNGVVTYRQDLQFFAFDSAAMVISPFKFIVNGADTVSTQVVALKVEQPFAEIPDDVSAMQDLKPVMKPDFVIWDYVRMMIWPLVILLVIVAIVLLYLYLRPRLKGKAAVVEKIVPQLPPHVLALNALNDLSARKLWQQGLHKQFHTELTEILRTYIEQRYHVPAMEKTSDEILEELIELTISQRSSYSNLKEVFQIADLVKFAKYEPLPDENQLVFMNSRLFIEQTKETVVETADGNPSEQSTSSQVGDTNKSE